MNTWMRRTAASLAGLAVLGITGCGSGDDYANDPRPAAPIVVTAAVTKDGVTVSPVSFGAGPINLIVTNQTEISQQVTLEAVDGTGASGISQSTGPINPRDTATLKADVPEGQYRVAVDGDGIDAAKLKVGPARPSAQNELLQP